ncbi:L-type lectin-domain containing receptor kinase IX.1-like [Hevea brasiliensis]|uniref:L-type lectin-domain containing receptor kinase IX.1-like n=1 Tax=Hevea brasiliensis TaxID=3981 RepID=UPI0025EA8A75|nr:L-type lectin-domain containing receptor kinase IX.1-like [Hevea brasiliensis]
MDHEFEQGIGPKRFSYQQLVQATNNFAEEGKLGQGGFGGVYRGYLSNLSVAVKRVSKGSKQGRKEYMSEVKIISKLRHKNLVQLVGWCHEKGEFLLIYEFMPNGSLDSHLFKSENMLSWTVRYKIAIGLASALLYLHEEWEQCVVHRDIKSSNVTLDSNFNTKLGDFGLARLMDNELCLNTTGLAGTIGYMAPEYISSGKASKGSDVFSFGVVALEIACGRRSQISLVGWAREAYGNGRVLDVADGRLGMDFNVEQMECLLTVGLWCAHPDFNLRPSIRQALQVLNFEAALPNLPARMPVPMYDVPASSTEPLLSTSLLTGR